MYPQLPIYKSIYNFFFFFLMIRRPPRSTRTTHSFPTRRSSDLQLPHFGRQPRAPQPQTHARAAAGQHQPPELERAADRDRDRLRLRGLIRLVAVAKEKRDDHRDAEQDRRGGVAPEFLDRTEDRPDEGRVGKGVVNAGKYRGWPYP